MPPTLRRLSLLLAAALVVTGCGGKQSPVRVALPSPTAAAGCGALAAALPRTLDGRTRRTTAPVSTLVAAWGSPAVVLRCGVPAVHTEAGDHVSVDGVGWLTMGPVNGRVVWTTTDRTTSVELSVPQSVNNQENLLGDLAPALTGSVSRVPAPASATATPGAAASG